MAETQAGASKGGAWGVIGVLVLVLLVVWMGALVTGNTGRIVATLLAVLFVAGAAVVAVKTSLHGVLKLALCLFAVGGVLGAWGSWSDHAKAKAEHEKAIEEAARKAELHRAELAKMPDRLKAVEVAIGQRRWERAAALWAAASAVQPDHPGLAALLGRLPEEVREHAKSSPEPVFDLPEVGVDASAVLGRPPAEVRKVLGTPAEQAEGADKFQVGGVRLSVSYERGRAVQLWVHLKGADKAPRQVRAWLGLPSEGEVEVDGKPFRVDALEGAFVLEDEAYRAEQDKRQEKVAKKLAAEADKKGRQGYASTMEKLFLDEGLDVRVRTRGRDASTLYILNPLCGRAMLHQMFTATTASANTAYDTAKKLGFKKVVCDDEFGGGSGVRIQ